MKEGLFSILVIGFFCGLIATLLITTLVRALIYAITDDDHPKIPTIVFIICFIGIIITGIFFGTSYTLEHKSVDATIEKIELQASGTTTKTIYKILANDNDDNTWEVAVDHDFYTNINEGDSVVINYDHIHYWNTDRNNIITVVRGK